MDGVERERKLDDLADLLTDYLGTMRDIVRSVSPEDSEACLAEVYRRAGLRLLED